MNIHATETQIFDSTAGRVVESELHPLRTLGPKFAQHNASAPLFEGIDVAGLIAAVIITLGPLAAYSLGMGA